MRKTLLLIPFVLLVIGCTINIQPTGGNSTPNNTIINNTITETVNQTVSSAEIAGDIEDIMHDITNINVNNTGDPITPITQDDLNTE
ncbi:Uncharacterised protein [Candidatus Tiddalikarchaeum anstoanum]|nr:Uncharacterised protein [Candidatus Tiddalikarchaeum anstoanum]